MGCAGSSHRGWSRPDADDVPRAGLLARGSRTGSPVHRPFLLCGGGARRLQLRAQRRRSTGFPFHRALASAAPSARPA